MSIFDRIKDAIFGHSAAVAGTSPSPIPAPGSSPETSASTPTGSAGLDQQASRPQTAATPGARPVDVEAVLNSLAAKQTQKLNWRTSIVDLLKLLSLDSSLGHRQTLAKELGYTGDPADSASMNVWLHKEVMRQLAQSGGKIPPDLLS